MIDIFTHIHVLSLFVSAQLLRCVQLSATPWTVAHQASLSMGFPRQEYWSGFLFPPPGDLPDRGIKPASPALASEFFTPEPPGKPIYTYQFNKIKAFIKSRTSPKTKLMSKILIMIKQKEEMTGGKVWNIFSVPNKSHK